MTVDPESSRRFLAFRRRCSAISVPPTRPLKRSWPDVQYASLCVSSPRTSVDREFFCACFLFATRSLESRLQWFL